LAEISFVELSTAGTTDGFADVFGYLLFGWRNIKDLSTFFALG